MPDQRPFFPPSSRALVGTMIAIVSGLYWYLAAVEVREQSAPLRWLEQNRAPGDSAVYASALYHASIGQGLYAGRWGLTGYMTLGVFGVAAGAAVALSALRRRTLNRPQAEAEPV